ncbi:hypothetical protein [Paenibacillus sp. FSL M7-0420]|uniref:hypothetical protein n=1 Tax=Paenibacillus sp. FSL M7-0420 TaxID=2921609 RepID=UPI0030FC89C0
MNFEQRNHWNRQHKILSGIITKPETHTEAVAIILELHTALYASEESNGQQITYEDSLGDKLLESTARSGGGIRPTHLRAKHIVFGFLHTFGQWCHHAPQYVRFSAYIRSIRLHVSTMYAVFRIHSVHTPGRQQMCAIFRIHSSHTPARQHIAAKRADRCNNRSALYIQKLLSLAAHTTGQYRHQLRHLIR